MKKNVSLITSDKFWDRIWGYWRSPVIMKINGLSSDRKEQQLRSFLMTQRGRGKSRPDTIYEKLRKPIYNTKWVKK